MNRPTPAVAPAANGIEVLLVDDEETIRVTLHDDLVAAGHKVTAVANGSDALHLIESRVFDAIVSDIRMPGVEGTDLLARVSAPTLALHCRDDAAVPFEQGRLIASRVPGARFLALDSRNHVLLPRDPAWAAFVSEVRRFLREGARTMSRA